MTQDFGINELYERSEAIARLFEPEPKRSESLKLVRSHLTDKVHALSEKGWWIEFWPPHLISPKWHPRYQFGCGNEPEFEGMFRLIDVLWTKGFSTTITTLANRIEISCGNGNGSLQLEAKTFEQLPEKVCLMTLHALTRDNP